MGVEDHGQGFPAALRMPEHTASSVCRHTFLRRLDGLTDSEVLVVSGEDLELLQALVGKADEVLDDVKETLLREHALEERVELRVLRILIAAVLRFPFHEAIFAGGDRASLAGQMVAHHADAVVDEHGRYLVHVVADLRVRFRRVGLLARRALKLHQHNRQTIQEKEYIRALVAVLNKCPLVSDDEGVVVRILVVNQIDEPGTFLAPDEISHLHAMLDIVHEHGVLLYEVRVIKVLQLEESFMNRALRHIRIDATDGVIQLLFIERVLVIPVEIRPVHMPPPHILEKLYDRILIVSFSINT